MKQKAGTNQATTASPVHLERNLPSGSEQLPESLRPAVDSAKASRKLPASVKLPHWIILSELLPESAGGAKAAAALLMEYQTAQSGGTVTRKLLEQAGGDCLSSMSSDLFSQWLSQSCPPRETWILSLTAELGSPDVRYRLAQAIHRSCPHTRNLAALDAVTNTGHPDVGLLLYTLTDAGNSPGLRSAALERLEKCARAAGLPVRDYIDMGFLSLPENPGAELSSGVSRWLCCRLLEDMISMHVRPLGSVRRIMSASSAAGKIIRELVWGVCQDSSLSRTFRFDDDGSLLDSCDRNLTLQSETPVTVAHPASLPAAECRQWRELLHDHQILQPFEQMNRHRMLPEPDEADALSIKRFAQLKTTASSICEVFLSARWVNDKPQESGDFTRFSRHFPEAGVYGCVRHEAINSWVLSDPDSEDDLPREHHDSAPNFVHELYFVRESAPRKSWRSAEARVRVRDVQPIVMSESLWLAAQAAGCTLAEQ